MSRAAARTLVLSLLLGAGGCSGGQDTDQDPGAAAEAADTGTAGTTAGAPEPELVIFVFDRSASVPDFTLTLARDLTERRLAELAHGDRIAAVQVLQRSRDEPPRRWSQDIPARGGESPRDSAMRADFLRDARLFLADFTDTTEPREILETDLLSTFHDVTEELWTFEGRRATAYLFSDMLQSNPRMNMEEGSVPSEEWVRDAASGAALPELAGLCVVVIGAGSDTERGRAVREFWEAYFRAAGATLRAENYLLRPPRLPDDPCPATGPATR